MNWRSKAVASLWAAARIPDDLDPQQAAVARFVVVAVVVSTTAVSAFLLASLLGASLPLHTLLVALCYGAGAIICFAALRSRRLGIATHIFVFQNWLAAAFFVALEGPGTGHLGVFFIAVILAGLLLSPRAAIVYGFASTGTVLAVQGLIAVGVHMPPELPDAPWLAVVSQLFAVGLLVAMLGRGLHGALAKLRESQQKLSAIVQNSPDGILSLDSSGRCANANPAALAMLERSRQSLIGALAADTGLWEKHAFDPESFEDGVSIRELRTEDGSLRVVELNGIRLRDGGRTTSFEFVLRDATERVRSEATRRGLEAHLRRSQKTEALGRLAGGVAHDFNNLLTIILSNSSALASRGDLGEATREQLVDIEHAALRAADVTRQLLAFGRKEERGDAAVDVGTLIRGCVRMFERFLGEGIRLDLALPESPSVIRIDPVQLEQVLVNLVVNAHDAMPHGGRLTLRLETVDLEPSAARALDVAAGRWVALEVTDTGTGMPEELAERAFEAFFTTKPEGQGTGLGLSTVELIVTQSGGRIRLDSRVGVGTTFKLLFPSVDAEPSVRDAPLPRPLGGKGELVCLVEDDPTIRKITERILEKSGYRVVSGPDGPTALERLATAGANPGILVTDVVLESGSGIEVANAFRALHPSVPVLYVSGYSRGLLAGRGLQASGDDVLAKPYSGEELTRRVRLLLDARSDGARP